MAYAHLSAYLQEACYWATRKSALNFSAQSSLSDFFQIAIANADWYAITNLYNAQGLTHFGSSSSAVNPQTIEK